jgi:hypothetical protein
MVRGPSAATPLHDVHGTRAITADTALRLARFFWDLRALLAESPDRL